MIGGDLMHIDPGVYDLVMREEARLADRDWRYPPDVETAWRLACTLEEVIKNSFVVRVCSRKPFQKHNPSFIPETDAAHTNLMRKLVDMYLSFNYGPELDRNNIPGGYSYREVIEAVIRHDLRENITGDGPDNGSRNEGEKIEADIMCWRAYSKLAPGYEIDFEQRINQLLMEMSYQSSELGRALYCADKLSAILTCLYLDRVSECPPGMFLRSSASSKQDRKEMRICEHLENGYRRASEMWTVDFLKLRRRVKFDDSGIFTGILVMYTLIVNKTWYDWRLRDYEEAEPR